MQLYFQDDQKNTQTQSVQLEAAALNLKGMSYLQKNEKEKAKSEFEKAILSAPGFKLAEGNLAVINQRDK